MSIDIPRTPDNSHGDDPLESLGLFECDPRFTEILETLKEREGDLQTADIDQIIATLKDINFKLDSMDWIGDRVEVTGKLRMAPWSDENDVPLFETSYFQHDGLRFGEDEHGRYCEANGLPLIFTPVDTDVADDDTEGIKPKRYVLTFVTPERMLDAKEDEESDIIRTAGDLIMYPDDMKYITFEKPSNEQIELTLSRHYPAVYKVLLETIGQDMGLHAHRMLSDLKSFQIPRGVKVPPEVLKQIGDYIYNVVDVDAAVDYDFTLSGTIGGLSIENGVVEAEQADGERLRGRIVAIDFDFDTYRPFYVVAEPTAGNDGFEARIIPVDVIKKLRNMRPMQKRFGETAMFEFEYPEQLADHWRKFRDEPIDPTVTELVSEPVIVPAEDDFLAAFAEMVNSMPEIRYNEKSKFYETPIDGDIDTLRNRYLENDAPSDEAEVGTEIVSGGDEIATSGSAVILQDKFKPIGLSPTQRLRGTFIGVLVTKFPDEVMQATGGEAGAVEEGLGMLVRDPVIFDDDLDSDQEELYRSFKAEAVIVQLTGMIGSQTRFTKIQHTLDDSDPSDTSL